MVYGSIYMMQYWYIYRYDNGDTVLVPLLSVDRINGLLMNWVNMTVVQNAVEAPL